MTVRIRLIRSLFSPLLCLAALLLSGAPGLACDLVGTASWYGGVHDGRKTASGETFNQWAMTAAMPSRARFGEVWRVTFKRKSVDVRITDLGPHKSLNRVIDLSRAAARKIGLEHAGIGRVCMERLS